VTVFYRIHWTECSPFTAANAWSSLTGIPRSEDGTKSECQMCDDGVGEWTECTACKGIGCDRCGDMGGTDTCTNCDSTGWEDCIRGYSAFASADELLAYFTDRSRPAPAADEPVITFEGWQADTGFDDEPTAVPEHIIETLNWAAFVARHAGATA
jgi:hypothetical protein